MFLVPGYRRAARWAALHVDSLVPTIVYQMAKVGSSAIVYALTRTGRPVFHVHRMSAEHLERMRQQRRALGWTDRPMPVHDRMGLMLREKIVRRGRRAKIVTLVRDPIARNFSSYFEHLPYIWGRPDAHLIPLDQLIRGFVDRFPHADALTWFDDEMLPVLGVDVYAHPFPSSGYLTIPGDPFDVLILKTEGSSEMKRAALSEFLGFETPPIERENVTASKEIGDVYREFTRTIRLSPAYVDAMLDARYTTHFYNAAERDAIRKRNLS